MRDLVPRPKEFRLDFGRFPDSADGPTLAQQLGYSKDSIIVIVHADDIGSLQIAFLKLL